MYKDTVMSDIQLEENINRDYGDFRVRDETGYIREILIWTREAQAEVSFKAGYDKALAQLAEMTEECKQIGRREVVKWINQNHHYPRTKGGYYFETEIWQAQLKVWGIDED